MSKELSDRQERTKQHLKAIGKSLKMKTIKLKCCLCGKKEELNISSIAAYTEEIQKGYKCIKCSFLKKP